MKGNMNKEKTLLFVGAHPDDETFGIGATLAQYTAAGVRVYYACATRGEAGESDPEHLQGYASMGDMRWAELECATRILGLAGVIHLGYRDSGMPGSADNKHPQSLVAAPPEQVVARVVKLIRELKPDVVITFDPIGGYRHPDHIAIHNATVKAFQATGDPKQFLQAGPAFQPQKLYFHIFPRRALKIVVKLMPLFRQDPHRLGRNKDIDLASLTEVQFPVHAVIRTSKQASQTRDRARLCYASQLGGSPRVGLIFRLLGSFSQRQDSFMRAHPPVTNRRRERDLFA